jgi:PhnB protein
MPALTPYLIVQDAAAAIDFYQRALGARELYRLTGPDGRIGHAELEFADSILMLAEEYPEFGALSPASVGGSPVSLHLAVDDVDAVLAKAESLGATLLRRAKNEFYGERTGMIADPAGHRWHLATRQEDVSPEEMQRRWNAAAAG